VIRLPLPRAAILAAALILLFASRIASAATSVTCTSRAVTHPEPTEYYVSLADAPTHVAHVSLRLPAGAADQTLNMPVWNALYQVRNFAANVENVRAQDATGTRVEVRSVQPSQWKIVAPVGCVVVSYDIYLNSTGPFGTLLDADRGFFNWAMVLMYSPALRKQPATLRLLDVPATWALRDTHVLGGTAPGKVESITGVAHSYDELVDSPAELGTFRESQFQQDGVTYHVVVDADTAAYDLAALGATLGKITHAAVDWMHDRPYDEYTFLYHFTQGHGGGGMEHAYGTAIEVNADRLRQSLLPVASVSAHEFFHLWNVKRIRPQSLEPIDYQHENDTRALWFSEGVTSTVSDMLLVRSGLIEERGYLQQLSGEITELQRRPAHLWQSAEDSSLDAWFEGNAFYRSPQRSISYYNKGEILGFLLDLRIRELTNGRKSLRDLFLWMNEHYAKRHLFFPDSKGVEDAAEAVTGQSFSDFFRDYVAGVTEIPYDEFLSFAGLKLTTKTAALASPGFTTTANLGAQPEVVHVEPEGPAAQAGILIGDRITAVNDKPADAFLDDEIARMRPETTIELSLQRHGEQRTVKLRLASRQENIYELDELPAVTPQQRAHRTAWLHGDDETGAAR
jgi:predicted metalloprotease with PDZ domain